MHAAALSTDALEMDYDKTASDRKSMAKSVRSCRQAIQELKAELVAWGERCKDPGQGGAGERLAEEMGREVLLVAITPTKQRMASSVGREVSGSLIDALSPARAFQSWCEQMAGSAQAVR